MLPLLLAVVHFAAVYVRVPCIFVYLGSTLRLCGNSRFDRTQVVAPFPNPSESRIQMMSLGSHMTLNSS